MCVTFDFSYPKKMCKHLTVKAINEQDNYRPRRPVPILYKTLPSLMLHTWSVIIHFSLHVSLVYLTATKEIRNPGGGREVVLVSCHRCDVLYRNRHQDIRWIGIRRLLISMLIGFTWSVVSGLREWNNTKISRCISIYIRDFVSNKLLSLNLCSLLSLIFFRHQ